MFEAIVDPLVRRSPSPYSPALRAGNILFVSGQTGWRDDGGLGSVEEQTRLILQRIEALLDGAGASRSHIVRTTVYLTDLDTFIGLNRVFSEFFDEPYPARTTVGANLIGVDIEIDAIAVLDA